MRGVNSTVSMRERFAMGAFFIGVTLDGMVMAAPLISGAHL